MRVVLLALGVLAGCRPDHAFVCGDAADCAVGGRAGRCEATGYCSAEDGSCASGWRYLELAGDGLGGTCVAGQPDAGGGFVANGGFERGVAGWVGFDATIELSDVARSGEHALLVCGADGELSFSAGDSPDSVPEPALGETYVARGWARAAPGVDAPLVRIILREPPPEAMLETASQSLALDDTWRALEVEHTIQSDSTLALIVAGAATAPGTCFLVDDLSIELR